jgi:hypothetical protein
MKLVSTLSVSWQSVFKASISLLLLLLQYVSLAAPPDIMLKAGLVINKSSTIKPGIYKLPAAGTDSQVITIEGDNITVDFQGAVLQGFIKSQYPDQYTGIGLQIKGNNVTIKNAVIKGYKVALLARNCENLHITKSDLSYKYTSETASLPRLTIVPLLVARMGSC